MSAALSEFTAALAAAGLAMHRPDVVADGQLHRYRVDGDKAGSLNGWYALHLDGAPFAAFGSWKTGQSGVWAPRRDSPLTTAERQAQRARLVAVRAARDIERATIQAEAAKRAAGLWEKAAPATNDHPYLVNKHVGAYGIRALRNQIVVPLRTAAGELTSLQFISPDGGKKLLTGGRKGACFHATARPLAALCICEGYATGATLYEATGHAVAVAFDAGNLLHVAKALHGKFPRLALVIAADNDAETPGNPGLTAATAAARAVGAALAVPFLEGASHV